MHERSLPERTSKYGNSANGHRGIVMKVSATKLLLRQHGERYAKRTDSAESPRFLLRNMHRHVMVHFVSQVVTPRKKRKQSHLLNAVALVQVQKQQAETVG